MVDLVVDHTEKVDRPSNDGNPLVDGRGGRGAHANPLDG